MTKKQYAAGPAVAGAGDKLCPDAFALTEHPFNPEEASVLATLPSGEKAKVLRVISGKPVCISGAKTVYDGEGTVVIAPEGIVFSGCADLTVKNLTVVGTVSVQNCRSLTLLNLDVQSEGDGITVDAASGGVAIKDCRVVAAGTGVCTEGTDTAVYASYVSAATGVLDAGKGTTVQSCRIEAREAGISSCGTDFAARENTVKAPADKLGIALTAGASCALVALNVIEGAAVSVKVNGAYNAVVLLNSAVSVVAEGNKNLYICENALGGRIEVKNNSYLLANGNTYADDGLDHTPVNEGNDNTNGDTVTDVNERLAVGANEALLPHTNKDLFVGMPRKGTVRDVAAESELDFNAYVRSQAEKSDVVIVAPGAYAVYDGLRIRREHSNTTIYAYGVYSERQTGTAFVWDASDTENVTLKGLTLGYKIQSSGQAYVLEKLGDRRLRVHSGAGMLPDYGATSPDIFMVWHAGCAHHAEDFYAWCDMRYESLEKVEDGSIIMTLEQRIYDKVNVGDVFTCRMMHGDKACAVFRSSNVKYEDFVLYANAGGLAFYEGQNLTETSYLRVHNTTHSGALIDRETYEHFKALEEKYGMSFEMSIDEEGRYRGSLPHIGSIDATHVGQCGKGSRIVSSIFENMCDDGTNQKGNPSRLAGLTDNGDGTTTLIYKGNWSGYSHRLGLARHTYCAHFKKGDRVFAYNSKGRLVCDTLALTEATPAGKQTNAFNGGEYETFAMKVATKDINLAALEGFDLADDNYEPTHKVLVDNMSRASNGCYFDNSVVSGNRSRGYLIKSSDVVIKNCTFRNVGMGAIGVLYEIFWGESGITEHMVIENNLFDHTGFFNPDCEFYAAISIQGMGESVEEDYLLHRDFLIRGNKIVNRVTKYSVYINSARDIKILDNDFGTLAGESEENPSAAIRINGAMNVEIAGNTFSPYLKSKHLGVVAERNKNIFGADISDANGSLVPDAEV